MAKAISLEDYIGIIVLGAILVVPIITVLVQLLLNLLQAILDITPFSNTGLLAGSVIGIVVFGVLIGISTRVFQDPLRFKFR